MVQPSYWLSQEYLGYEAHSYCTPVVERSTRFKRVEKFKKRIAHGPRLVSLSPGKFGQFVFPAQPTAYPKW